MSRRQGPGYPSSGATPPPVRWDPGRDARGASTSHGPRCPDPGCPVRWRAGPDRPCPEHTAPPGSPRPLRLEPWQRDGLAYLLAKRARHPTRTQQRAMAALLADPMRSNRDVGQAIGTGHMIVCAVRHELEDAGLIPVYRAPSRARMRHPTALQIRVMAALLADPERSNRAVGEELGTNNVRVTETRHALEAAGLIQVYRATSGRRPGHTEATR